MYKALTLALLGFIAWRSIKMSAELARLQAEMQEQTGVIDSAITLIEGLAQQIRDNATDPAALNALADQLDANTNRLGAAVAAGTPVADEVEDQGDLEPIPADDGTGTGEDTTGTGGTEGGTEGGGEPTE